MSSQIQFHAHPQSPPCRAVQMTFHVIGKDYEYKYCDILNGAHKKAEFLKVIKQVSCTNT